MIRKRFGMIRARHEMPVSEYWLDKVPNAMDFDWLRVEAFSFCSKQKANNVHVDLFVTGLSTALAAFIEAAFATKLSFSLWHWKPRKHVYKEQKIYAPWVWHDFKDATVDDIEIINQAVCRDYLDVHDMKPYIDDEWLEAFSTTQDLETFLDTEDIPMEG